MTFSMFEMCQHFWQSYPFSDTTLPQCAYQVDQWVLGRGEYGNIPRGTGASHFPSWNNLTLAYQGQQVFNNYFYSFTIARIFGFPMFLNQPDARDVFMFTGGMGTVPHAE